MCFWNIAGVTNKDEETWEYLSNFEVVGLQETWVEEDKWEKIKDKLPKNLEWKCRPAKRENRKGRAKGGIITGVSKRLKSLEYKEWNDNIVERRIRHREKEWRLLTVYSQNVKEILDTISEGMEENEEEILIIGGDWNARTGKEGGWINETTEKEEETRKSKDKVINGEGRRLISGIEERGWGIINGSKGEEGEWTYVGENGESVIDYIITNQEAVEEIESLKIGDRVESDHMPLEVKIYGMEEGGKEGRREEKRIEKREWNDETKEEYLKNCEEWSSEKEETEGLWKEIKDKIEEAIPKIRKRRYKWKMGERIWHDKEWKNRKREIRRIFRNWRKGKCGKDEYWKERKEYKEWCKEKKREHERQEEEKIRGIRTEQEAWKYINRFRKRREGIDEEISMDKWKQHFMEILEGEEKRIEMEEEKEEEEEEEEEEQEITREEVIEQLKRLKMEKAPGEDGLENEVWRYMPKSIGEAMVNLLNKIWKGGGIPQEWKKGVICPIFKKGDKKETKNYRGVTLMDTAYKVYASILNEKLMREVKDKLGEGQFGFRKKRGVMDAVYVLNHIVDRELGKKKGKVFVCFADLKAAFDRVDRVVLKKRMKKIGISKKLSKRIMETYKETKNVVKIGEKYTEEFWTRKGVRQGCPMSPTLFNIYVADLEEEMRKEQTGGVMVGRRKTWTLTYADDVVLMAEREEELKGMLKRFKKFLDKRELRLNPEKTKIMVFEKGRGRAKKREWKWEEEKLEEVKEIRYLGYIVQKNGGAEKHIMERKKKAMIAMKKTWSIGERIFKEDYIRRMKMFEALVESVGLFGAEIWGWRKEERLDGIKRKYTKWILGLERTTPNYILIEEGKLIETKIKAIKRAVKYEEEARNSEKILVKECLEEKEKDWGVGSEGKWAKMRKRMMEEEGYGKREREKCREEGKDITKGVIKNIMEKEVRERRKRIEESRYNKEYKRIIKEEKPEYLKRRMKMKDRKMVARFRCGNEVREREFWKEEEEKMCRVCRKEKESLWHVIRECEGTRQEEELEVVLGEEGKGLRVLRMIVEKRKVMEEKNREMEGEIREMG